MLSLHLAKVSHFFSNMLSEMGLFFGKILAPSKGFALDHFQVVNFF